MAEAKRHAGSESRRELLRTELERFIDVASEEFGAEKVIVFGSLARALKGGEGRLGEWSDLDLIVVAETKEPFYERIKQLTRRVRPRVAVDVLVYTPLEWECLRTERPFVKNEVLGKGRVVYERTG